MDIEESQGNMRQEKWENGFPHTIDGAVWCEWEPVEVLEEEYE